MSENYVQYQVDIPDEDAGEIFGSLAKALNIEFDSQRFEEAIKVEVWGDPKGICIFRDKNNSNRFIMLDAATSGYIDTLIVRCIEEESESIKAYIIDTINKLYEDQGLDEEDFLQDLDNKYKTPEDGYEDALKRCGLMNI